MSQAHQHTDMRIMLQFIASLACLSIAVATPGTATPLYPGLSGAAQMESSTRVVLVAKKEKQTKRGNYNGKEATTTEVRVTFQVMSVPPMAIVTASDGGSATQMAGCS